MYTQARAHVLGLLALYASLAGCNFFQSEEAPPAASADSEQGRPLADFELPVSLRLRDPAPSGGAGSVEATDEQLRLDGKPVLALARGRVEPAEQADGTIPKLVSALSAAHRSSVALRLQANIPYETAALVVSSAAKAGIHDVAFNVRSTGEGKQTGWIQISGFSLATKADDLPSIPSVEAKSWNAFTDKWQAIHDGCRTSTAAGNCAYVNDNFAQGGTLKIELMASGRGVNLNFLRRGLSAAQEKDEEDSRERILGAKKEDFLQGRITHDEMVEALLLGDPSTYALFQFRYQEALKAPSPITATMAPICHSERCGVLLTADKITPVLNLVSLLGAAFPDGTPMPAIAFEQPWTERPKPAVLADFIAQQMKKD